MKYTSAFTLFLQCAFVLACCCYNVRLLRSTGRKMDSQKDVQPPKQQPMIYICGGNCNLKKNKTKNSSIHHYNCLILLNLTLPMSIFPECLFVMYIIFKHIFFITGYFFLDFSENPISIVGVMYLILLLMSISFFFPSSSHRQSSSVTCFLRWLFISLLSLVYCFSLKFYLKSVTLRMKSRPEIRSDAESAATGSCTRRGQRDVSFTTANPINSNPHLLQILTLFP